MLGTQQALLAGLLPEAWPPTQIIHTKRASSPGETHAIELNPPRNSVLQENKETKGSLCGQGHQDALQSPTLASLGRANQTSIHHSKT